MGNRYTANTIETTTLDFVLTKNGVSLDAHEINEVTIHATYEDAIANTNIIQTISSGSITHTSTGLYEYTAAIITTAGIKYDKIFLTPEDGGTEISFINTFNLVAPIYLGTPSTFPTTCLVSGKIQDGDGEGVIGVLVHAIPANFPSKITGTSIAMSPDVITAVTTSTGYFELNLLRNTEFIVAINGIGFKEKVYIPDEETAILWNLSEIVDVGGDSGSGEVW